MATLAYLLAPWLMLAVDKHLGWLGASIAIVAVLASYRMGDTFGNHLVQHVILLSSVMCIAGSLFRR